MRKWLFVSLILVLLPYASASSSIKGWAPVPSLMGISENPLNIKDISPSDGALLIEIGPNSYILQQGGSLKTDFYSINFSSAFLSENGGYVLINVTFPYLLENQSLLVGDYQITLLSVSEKEAKIRLVNGENTKEITYNGGEKSFNRLSFRMELLPLIFDGYLTKGYEKTLEGWKVKFVDSNVTEVNGELKEFVEIQVNGDRHWVEVGESLETKGLLIETKDLIGSIYLKVKIKIKGVYIHASLNPDLEKDIEEGKTTFIGPYLIAIEKIFPDGAYVSIKNSCGMPLKGEWIHLGTLKTLVSYDGIEIGIIEIKESTTKKTAKVIAFLDEEKLPKPEKSTFVNVTFTTPESVLQFEPFNATVTIKNVGQQELNYVEIVPKISADFEILNEYPQYIQELKPGDTLKFKLHMYAKSSGKLEIGKIEVHGNTPYQLSCSGFAHLSFSSETRWINVEKASPKYVILLEGKNGTINEPLPLNITVINHGNTKGPFTLTLLIPERFGVIGKNVTLYGRMVSITDSTKPEENKTYSIYIIPTYEGRFELLAGLKERDYIAKNSTFIEISSPKPPTTPENEEFATKSPQNTTTNSTKIITETQTITETYTQIINNTMEVFPIKQKIIFTGGGFIGGVIFILLLAWIAAKLEERRK